MFGIVCSVSVKVNFEDKLTTGATAVIMDVNPNMTCLAVKKLVSEFVNLLL